jgi:tRNA-dihydrouridine synthase
MLGRGAIADPWLFQRIRAEDVEEPHECLRAEQVRIYLLRLLHECRQEYAGEHQVLAKLKNVVQFIGDQSLRRWCGRIKRTGSLARFTAMVESLKSAED